MIRRLLGEHGHIVEDRQFQVLLLAGVTSPLGVSLVSPLLDSLVGPLGTTPTRVGLLVSAYTAPAVVMVPLSGVLTDRYGRKPVLVAGLLVFGTAGLAVSLVTEFRQAVALRVVQGVGFAGVGPVAITSIGDVYSDAEAATGQGLRQAAIGGVQTVFPLLGSFLLVVAWQLPFLIYGLALPVAVAVLRWFEEPSTVDRDGPGAGVRAYGRRLLGFAAQPPVLALLAAYSGPVFLYFGFQAYVSIVVVRVLGGTPREAGLLVALFSVVYALAASQSGRVTGRFGGRLGPLLAGNAVMAAGLATLAFAPSVPVAVLGGGVFGVGFGVASALYRSVLPDFAPDRLRGGAVSLGESLGRGAGTVAPLAIGAAVGALAPAAGVAAAVRWSVAGVGAAAGAVGLLAVAFVGLTDPEGRRSRAG